MGNKMVINPNRLCKIGRMNKIFEINDKLQVNDFYNVSGVLSTTVHGTFSRISLCLVDTTQGKKTDARVGEFNFSVEEFNKLVDFFKVPNMDLENIHYNVDPSAWKANVQNYNKIHNKNHNNFLYSIKVNPYKKDENGFSPVNKIALSYEEQMRSEYKWKITIEAGKGIANAKQYAFKYGALKQGTYQKLFSIFINISTEELINILAKTYKHIKLWETSNYPIMLDNRRKFWERFKENNYNEETLNIWNNNPFQKAPTKNKKFTFPPQANAAQSNILQNKNVQGYACSKCGYKIDQKIKNYSEKAFGAALCFKCQNEVKNSYQQIS